MIAATMTHPFCGRKPASPFVRIIDPVDLIRLAAYFVAVTAPQKRISKNRRALFQIDERKLTESSVSPAVNTR